jgi:murein DD-endopeptidase MepM/ murein hydrolase activator NlpD
MNSPAMKFLKRLAMKTVYFAAILFGLLPNATFARNDIVATNQPEHTTPLFRVVDLNRGEAELVQLSNRKKVSVKLIEVAEIRDPIRSAVREAQVTVEINGKKLTLNSGNYHLPIEFAGVQIDCPVTKGYYVHCDPFEDSWGLDKDARLRVWAANSPWFEPRKFVYPARQRWFATQTQIGNEPSYVDGGDCPPRAIYYHSGNDIGGCEGLIDVVSACDGLVVSARGKAMEGYTNAPFYKPHGDYDYVYVLDEHGWFYRYAHLQSIDETVQPGKKLKAGDKIGVLGKEGSSGGWAHLHFDIKALQPSGKWGIQDAYPFLWEAYVREHKPQVIAVARPHRLAQAGDVVVLDASRSWSSSGKIQTYQWSFTDGSSADGARVERRYEKPGAYSEVLKVVDRRGRVGYDIAIVQVFARNQTNDFPPTIHAAYSPTFGIRAGDPVTFKVRTFRTTKPAVERWNFGDGSPSVEVQSDGNANPLGKDGYAVTEHRYAKPGHYVARVDRSNGRGENAVARLVIEVLER